MAEPYIPTIDPAESRQSRQNLTITVPAWLYAMLHAHRNQLDISKTCERALIERLSGLPDALDAEAARIREELKTMGQEASNG